MKRSLLWVLCALLPACAFFRRPPRPVYAPPQEAAAVTFPVEPLELKGSVTVSGNLLAAVELAMEDFLPWDLRVPTGATPREVCLAKRETYDVIAAPGDGGLVFVQIWVRPGACEGPMAVDLGAYYAIDVVQRRIVAARR
ncbi:hypothetical protein [Hyalangium versicolor]|uniref:hypothetical protein n=1 Tax=Hyalangium versicolor TaxID=2861190 RepID=UPI001CCE7B18|nr:hypothetical protein [Hyalangium versicolor]